MPPCSLRILVVTAGALALGAYRVVGKPFDMGALEALVVSAHDARPH